MLLSVPTIKVDVKHKSIKGCKSKDHDFEKDDSDDSDDSDDAFYDQDELYLLPYEESESRLMILLISLLGILATFSIALVTIIHFITFEELPILVHPNIQSSKTRGTIHEIEPMNKF